VEPSIKSLKTVVVDDDNVMRGLLRGIINSAGHEVIGEASNGSLALEMVRRLKPHVVTLDIDMPQLSGLEVLSEICRARPQTFVLMASICDDKEIIRQALSLGAIGYVTKPFTSNHVLRVFDQLSRLGMQQTEKPAGYQVAPVQTKRCVIVDEDASFRLQLRGILETAGIAVVAEADNGMDGLEVIERERPNLVCIEVDIPKVDGLSVLSCLRAVHAHIPVIILSTHADRNTIDQAVQLRTSAYLIKPFEPEKVLAVVRNVLKMGPEVH
jgi:DNA-binding NarL/FixJ family response regulator